MSDIAAIVAYCFTDRIIRDMALSAFVQQVTDRCRAFFSNGAQRQVTSSFKVAALCAGSELICVMRLFPVGIHFHVAGARQGIHLRRTISARAQRACRPFQGNQLRVNRFD